MWDNNIRWPDEEWDGLRICENCENAYTTGRLCSSCAQQEMIDNDPGPYGGGSYNSIFDERFDDDEADEDLEDGDDL